MLLNYMHTYNKILCQNPSSNYTDLRGLLCSQSFCVTLVRFQRNCSSIIPFIVPLVQELLCFPHYFQQCMSWISLIHFLMKTPIQYSAPGSFVSSSNVLMTLLTSVRQSQPSTFIFFISPAILLLLSLYLLLIIQTPFMYCEFVRESQ